MQHRGIQGWIHRMPNGRRLSLQAQSAILLAAALVVTTVAGSLVSIAMMREEQAIARDALAAALLEKDFASLERDVYRHTTLGTAETRADMEQNIAELMGAVRTAKATFGSDQVAEFQRIEAAAADYVAKVAAATSGPRSPSLVAAMAEAGGAADDAIEAVRDPIIAREKETASLQEQLALAVAIASLLIALLSGAISWLLARSVRRAVNGDIESLRHSVSAIAAGRLDEAVPLADRSDEIGDLARASETLRQNSIAKREGDEETAAMVAIVGESLEKLAAGDLTVSVPSLGSRYDLLHTNLNVMIARLREAIGLVAEAAARITGSAGEISQASTDLAQRTEVHSAELAQASNAIGQITTSIHASAESAESANAAVTIAVTEAGEGAAIARQAVEAMANIERTTGEIGNIIAMIDSIAFQTNLLALNAGVEAARAGDLGNGFAVVANEVRALAQRSADAATDIKSLITGSAEHVSAGAGLVRQAGGALERIGQRIDEVTGMVRGITEASSEQAARLSATNDSVSSMDRVTQHSAAMAEESTAVAQSLAAEATRLSELVARFRLATDAPAVPVRPARATVVPAQPAVSVRPLPSPPRRAAAGGAAVAAVAEDWTEF